MVLTRILNGCTVENDPEGCCHIGKDSYGLSCQKDSEGLCVVRNLRGYGVEEDSEIVSR